MNKLIGFSRPFILQPLGGNKKWFLPKTARRNFFLCFSDALAAIFIHYKISGKNDFILMPSFYCPDALRIINQRAKIIFYEVNNDFSINKESYFNQIIEYQPKIILNYCFTGFDLTTAERKKIALICPKNSLIIEDCAHRILEKKDIKPVNANHFYIDSIRKFSPFLGSHLINTGFNCAPNTVDKINFYQIKCHFLQLIKGCLYFLSYLFNSRRFYLLAEEIFFKLDGLIGEYQRPTLGSCFSYKLYSFLNLNKIKNQRKSLASCYHRHLSPINHPDFKNLGLNRIISAELNYYPIFVNPAIRNDFLKYLNEKNIFAEILWEIADSPPNGLNKYLYASLVILPLTYLTREKDVKYIASIIKDFFDKL